MEIQSHQNVQTCEMRVEEMEATQAPYLDLLWWIRRVTFTAN